MKTYEDVIKLINQDTIHCHKLDIKQLYKAHRIVLDTMHTDLKNLSVGNDTVKIINIYDRVDGTEAADDYIKTLKHIRAAVLPLLDEDQEMPRRLALPRRLEVYEDSLLKVNIMWTERSEVFRDKPVEEITENQTVIKGYQNYIDKVHERVELLRVDGIKLFALHDDEKRIDALKKDYDNILDRFDRVNEFIGEAKLQELYEKGYISTRNLGKTFRVSYKDQAGNSQKINIGNGLIINVPSSKIQQSNKNNTSKKYYFKIVNIGQSYIVVNLKDDIDLYDELKNHFRELS